MPDLAGAVPHSRFTTLSNKTVLFLADFDGEPGKLRRGQYVRS
jgi:hypothetical protein